MASFSDEFLREVKDKNDIIDVAGSYATLKRSGNTYSCCCPFHMEKTPSCHFWTGPDAHFYCFGCHKGGSVFNFIMEAENLSFPESVKFLAERAGMALPDDTEDNSTQKRMRIFEMNKQAGSFFHKALFSDAGKAGLDYLTNRGLTVHTIRRFGLGYAADSWDTLRNHMHSLGYNDLELADASLLSTSNHKFFDKFRNRVMFPIFDTRGNVVGFGGRTLGEDKAKYLNSSETPVFHKSNMLYAMNIAKNSKADYFILCEGYMDVIAMHQAGFDSAVASLGTSLTEQHANLLSRLGKKEVILSYDSDSAGQNATTRAINIFSNVGIRARVLKIDGAKDPDEFIKKNGGERFRDIIDSSGGALDYQLDKLSKGIDFHSDADKVTYLTRAVEFLAQIESDLERAVYISKVSKLTDIPQATVTENVDKLRGSQKKKARREEQQALIRPARDIINPDAQKLPREEKAERGIICYLYHNPEQLEAVQSRLNTDFETEFNKKVFARLENKLKSGTEPDISMFSEEFNSTEMGRITEIISDTTFAHNKEALSDFIEVLNNRQNKPFDIYNGSDEDLEKYMESLKEKKRNE